MATSLSVDEWETAEGNFVIALFFTLVEWSDATENIKKDENVLVTEEHLSENRIEPDVVNWWRSLND